MKFKIKKHKYPKDMDKCPSLVHLCDALNSMKGVKTVESCSGHSLNPTTVFFYCKDFESLARIQRSIDVRYTSCNTKWELGAVTTDVSPKKTPPIVFYIRSKEVYKTHSDITRDLEMIVLDLEYYHTPFFNRWFHDPRSCKKRTREDQKVFDEYMKRYDAIDQSYYQQVTLAKKG